MVYSDNDKSEAELIGTVGKDIFYRGKGCPQILFPELSHRDWGMTMASPSTGRILVVSFMGLNIILSIYVAYELGNTANSWQNIKNELQKIPGVNLLNLPDYANWIRAIAVYTLLLTTSSFCMAYWIMSDDTRIQNLARPTPKYTKKYRQVELEQQPVEIEILECPECGADLKEGFDFCPKCGYETRLFNCPQCGKEVSKTYRMCPYCGYKLKK